jgi:hypothetical protein
MPDRIQKPHPSRRRNDRVRKINETNRIAVSAHGADVLRLLRPLSRQRASIIGNSRGRVGKPWKDRMSDLSTIWTCSGGGGCLMFLPFSNRCGANFASS